MKETSDLNNILINIYVQLKKNTSEQIEINKKLDKIEKLINEKNNINITDNVIFLNKYCPDVKPLKLLTDEEIDELLGLDDYGNAKFEKFIINCINDDSLHIEIGDLILKNYLNLDDPTKQQMWTSDISRTIYLISQMIGNKKKWIRDKEGKFVIKLVIKPIISRIEKIMIKYSKHNKITYILNNLNNKKYIDKLNNRILKYMASELSIVVKKDEIIENE